MYLRNSNLVCIYVGFYINEFAEDGAETQNATAVSPPRPRPAVEPQGCMYATCHASCVGFVASCYCRYRTIPTYLRYVLIGRRWMRMQHSYTYYTCYVGMLWYNINHVATQN